MTEKPQFFDVWITDRNMVYQKVPFTVVGDWITEGRLLENDRVRPAGGPTWQRLADNPLLSAYLPRKELFRAEDQAEALEKVELDFSPKNLGEADDDDVDMIPLIDISMVLLVFFMMTAQDLMTSSPIDVPGATNVLAVDTSGTAHLGVKDEGGQIKYYLNEDYENALNEQQFLSMMELGIKERGGNVTVAVRASGNLPFEKFQWVTLQLERMGVKAIQAPVKERKNPGGGEGEAAQ